MTNEMTDDNNDGGEQRASTAPWSDPFHPPAIYYPLDDPEVKTSRLVISPFRYLSRYPGGFQFREWYLRYTVAYYKSVDDPEERIIVKRVKDFSPRYQVASDPRVPAEIEISTFRDGMLWPGGNGSMVTSPLPKKPLMVFAELLDFKLHADGAPPSAGDATLFFKMYNRGALYDAAICRLKKGRHLPEFFLWHFIAQIGRALAYLHTGMIIPPADADGRTPPAIPPAADNNNAGRWDPIAHNDAHCGNVFVHVPSEREKADNPYLAAFDDDLPQLVLGDFGRAFRASRDDPRKNYLATRSRPDIPQRETWLDKAFFGRTLAMLIFAEGGWDYSTHVNNIVRMMEGAGVFDRSDIYSEELMLVLDRFKDLVFFLAVDRGKQFVPRFRDYAPYHPEAVRREWPVNEWLYGEDVIGLADRKVWEYRLRRQKRREQKEWELQQQKEKEQQPIVLP